MNKKTIIFISIIIILLILIIFIKNNYKKITIGNNINKSTESVIEYILNISSYKAKIQVTVNSNKTTNQYELTQEYSRPNISKQIVNKPDYISGLIMKYDGNNLILENTNLSISKVYEKYQYLNNNCLWLNSFIENYKSIEEAVIKETEDEIILEVKDNSNIYTNTKKLYIDKKTIKPTRLEIMDNNKKNRIYIIYKEIEINSTNKDEILGFKSEEKRVEL